MFQANLQVLELGCHSNYRHKEGYLEFYRALLIRISGYVVQNE